VQHDVNHHYDMNSAEFLANIFDLYVFSGIVHRMSKVVVLLHFADPSFLQVRPLLLGLRLDPEAKRRSRKGFKTLQGNSVVCKAPQLYTFQTTALVQSFSRLQFDPWFYKVS
jgi:hypothetical protein